MLHVSFGIANVEEDQVYSGPYLVKGGHMDILVRSPRQFSDVQRVC